MTWILSFESTDSSFSLASSAQKKPTHMQVDQTQLNCNRFKPHLLIDKDWATSTSIEAWWASSHPYFRPLSPSIVETHNSDVQPVLENLAMMTYVHIRILASDRTIRGSRPQSRWWGSKARIGNRSPFQWIRRESRSIESWSESNRIEFERRE